MIASVCRVMGWTWEYVEHTVTAARLDAIVNSGKPPTKSASKKVTLEELRAQFPDGIKQ